MKIYVVGNSKDLFLKLDNIREKFLVDQPHNGDNIDDLNPLYCELTGLYHLWKNTTDDIIGLEHYRRYFIGNKKILSEEEINEALKDNDIILRRFIYSTHGQKDGFQWPEQQGILTHFIEFLYQVNEPEFAMHTLHLLKTSSEFAQCNMFIGKRKVIDDYCSYLFGLFDKADFEHFKQFKRLYGYFGEFMFFSWLIWNKVKYTWRRTVTFYADDFKRIGEITPGESI